MSPHDESGDDASTTPSTSSTVVQEIATIDDTDTDDAAVAKTVAAETPAVAVGVVPARRASVPPDRASTPPTPVTRIAQRYELLGLVGTGGMGSVYRVRDVELDEVVALKVLRHELVRSSEMLARFRREVSLARKVTHPNVARTFDIGEHDGDRFLTMELVEGESLATHLERTGALAIPTFLDLAGEICRGLEAAHGAGVIHLDLKPDNVLIARDGHPVISDFGIARAIGGGHGGNAGESADNDDDAPSTHHRRSIAGTPAYMAPEQVMGEALDEAADIYALGAILFEMLTGVLAWDGTSAFAVASARLLRPPPDPRKHRAEIPEDIANVILRCMAREPSNRFAAVSDVRAALEVVRISLPSTPRQRAAALAAASSAISVVASAEVAGTTTTTTTTETKTNATNAAAPSGSFRTVAVLPFKNRGDVSDEYLADGFTEELIDAMGDSPSYGSRSRIRVRARGAVMSFKGKDRDPRDVGRLLGVEAVIEGSLRRAAGMLHVNARMICVEDGYHLWARRFDVSERQLLNVTDEIAAATARALEADAPEDDEDDNDDGENNLESPSPQQTAVKAPHTTRRSSRSGRDDVAFDLFLRGRYELNKGSAEFTRAAIALFERALMRLPNDPMILSAYAQAQFRRATFDVEDPNVEEAANIAERAARRALELAPTLGEARVALASLRLSVGDGVAAAQIVVEALRAGGYASPLVQDLRGRLLAEVASPEEALKHLQAAVAIEPTLERTRADILRLQALCGQWEDLDEVLARVRTTTAFSPSSSSSLTAPTTVPGSVFWFLCARLSLWNTNTSWAVALRQHIERLDFPQRAMALGLLRVRLGELEPAELAPSLLAMARQQGRGQSTRGSLFMRQLLTEIYLFADHVDEAIASMEKAVELGLFDIVWLTRSPLLQRIAAHSDTRLVAIHETVGKRARAIRDVLTKA